MRGYAKSVDEAVYAGVDGNGSETRHAGAAAQYRQVPGGEVVHRYRGLTPIISACADDLGER